ncbi:Outer membrane lipoprotein carrier protein LolA [Candidatus Electronema halotolerans]
MSEVLPRIFKIIFLFLFCCLTTANAAQADLRPQVEAVQQRYRSLTSLSFNFRQTTGSGGRARHGAGNCIFYRPAPIRAGIMRWNYMAPDVQIIVNDGKQLSIYNEKDKQLLVSSAKELESDITYSLFAGKGNLLDDFSLEPADSRAKTGNGLYVVKLVPKKPHGQIKSVHCWFDKNSVIRQLVLEDHFDTLTKLEFSNIKFNTFPANSAKVEEELVRLNVPQGTEVVRQ